jgi:hypothetical protein
MKALPSVRKGVLRHNLDSELLVYDPADEQIHLLNPSAAKVLDMMLEGFDYQRIVAELEADAPKGSGEDLLELAIGELAAARLFEEKNVFERASMQPTTRREMLLRAASIGAVIAIPTVLTLAPNKAIAQGGTSLTNGTACARSNQCLSGCCGGNSAGGCTSNHCVNGPPNCTSCTV